jgi:hypothetical protein
MSIHVSCPACRKTLNVPDHLLGKRVKCPECATPFDAQPDAPPQAAGFPGAPVQPAPPSEPNFPPPPPAFSDLAGPPGYDLPGDRDDSFGRRDVAQARVLGPAIGLMVAPSLGILLSLFSLVLNLGTAAGNPALNNRPNQQIALALGLGVAVLSLVLNGLIIYGANEMRTLGSKGMAMTACILGIINLPGCCLILCMPFAIWGLVVINDPEVSQAFRSGGGRRRY